MSKEFVEFGDRVVSKPESSTKLIILDDLKRTTERLLDLARLAESPSDQEENSSEGALAKKTQG